MMSHAARRPCRLGNTFKRRLDHLRLTMAEIRHTDYTDQALVAVQHRKPPHLVFGHDMRRRVKVVILEAVADIFRHSLAYPALARLAVVGDTPDHDIAI